MEAVIYKRNIEGISEEAVSLKVNQIRFRTKRQGQLDEKSLRIWGSWLIMRYYSQKTKLMDLSLGEKEKLGSTVRKDSTFQCVGDGEVKYKGWWRGWGWHFGIYWWKQVWEAWKIYSEQPFLAVGTKYCGQNIIWFSWAMLYAETAK